LDPDNGTLKESQSDMDVGTQRKIDRAVGPLICRALSFFGKGRGL
jgi:hypothetical protein